MDNAIKEQLLWIYPVATILLSIWCGYFFWPVNDGGLQLACILTAIIIIIVPTMLIASTID